MSCSACGMPCQGSMCKPCTRTREMEEALKAQKASEDATEEGEE